LPDEITLTASAVRDISDGTVIEGTTNLPDGTKLGVVVMKGDQATAEDFKVFVASGRFRSGGFRKGATPLPPGKQRFRIFTHFNTNWQTPTVLNLVGTGGSKLKPSAVIHSEDPQLIDGEKILEYTAALIIPPLGSVSTKINVRAEVMPADHAIEIVKKAILVVDGYRSSETVEGGVNYYFLFPGIRTGNGWSATQTGPNTFNVTVDFVNAVNGQEQHESAAWEVNTATKKVLYRNKNAKRFSWIPAK
jgi:hypothetical protein